VSVHKQLADTDSKVALVALSVLDEAADESACLDSMIAKKCYDLLVDFPSQATIKSPEKGHNLLMRFLSRSTGFKYVCGDDGSRGGTVAVFVALESSTTARR
jgi:hypothetical protein